MSREYTSQQSDRRARGRRYRILRNINDPARILSDSESTSRLRGNQPFEVSRQIPDSFLLKHIAGRSNLRVAWNHLASKGGQAVGTDRISFDISSSMAWRVVRHLEEDVLGGTYRPGATREVRIPRPGKTDRVIEIPTIRDRVIGKAIASALRPVLAPVLTRYYGVGREHIFARMKVEAEVNNRFYILQDDIQNCYPTANREMVMNVVRQSSEEWCVVDMPTEEFGLTDLIHTIVYGQDGIQSTGLTQGGTLSPLLMELLLHTTVDAAFHAASSTNTTLHRYVDDLCVQAQSPSDALEAMDMIRNQVNQNGQTLKGTSTGPIDLRRNSSEETVRTTHVFPDRQRVATLEGTAGRMPTTSNTSQSYHSNHQWLDQLYCSRHTGIRTGCHHGTYHGNTG